MNRLSMSVNNIIFDDGRVAVSFACQFRSESACICSPFIPDKPRANLVRRAYRETKPAIKEWAQRMKTISRPAWDDLVENFEIDADVDLVGNDE